MIRVSLILAAAVASIVTPALALGTRTGAVIRNQATVNYRDVNNNPLQALSNEVTTTVSQVAAVDVAPNGAQNADPGDVVYYAHTVTNNGNGDDTIDLTAVSGSGWTVQIYRDVDLNGAYTLGTDTLLTTTDADSVPDTGLLADNGTFRIIVAVSVPTGAANGAVDTVTVTGTSTFNTAISETATDTTTIQAPVLGVAKSVAPLGNQPPLTVLTYTMVVTNNGAGPANSVVLTDPIPANTTYVGSSITYNGGARGDGTLDGDNADHNVTNSGRITVNVGTLAPAASATITFQVRIN